jgi:hypothetical protein
MFNKNTGKCLMAENHRALIGALLLLSMGGAAGATDSYSLTTRLLTIPSVSVGSYTLADVLAPVSAIVTQPSGSSASGSVDSYDPSSRQLTVQSVLVEGQPFFNAVLALGASPLATIGGAVGADTYIGGQLTIQNVQVGNTIYTDVVVNVALGNVKAVAGGMPAAFSDVYAGGALSVPVVSAFGRVYTNVTINVAPSAVVSIGGSHPLLTNVLSTGFYSNGTTRTTTSETGTYGTYFGVGGTPGNIPLSGSGGGYLDSSPPVSPGYEIAEIDDTLGNIGSYDFQGVFVRPAGSQTVSMVGKNNLSVRIGMNPEWFSIAGGANFVVEITANVPGVSTANCNPRIGAVIPGISNPDSYAIPLSTMAITQNCGSDSITTAQVLAGKVVQVDFEADGGSSAITVSGITSNSNLTVAQASSFPAVYPTAIVAFGDISFAD